MGVAFHDINQGNNLEAGRGRAAERFDLPGRRAFFHESEPQPLLDFTIGFAQTFGEFHSSLVVRRAQHRRSETQAPSQLPLAKRARRWREQKVYDERHSRRNPDKEPSI